MRFKKILITSLLLNAGLCHTALADDYNYLTIYVSSDTPKCISFNLVKVDQPVFVKNTHICPGEYGRFMDLIDGQYRLFGTGVDSISVNPYGDNEYINNPILLSNNSDLAVYYPSRFNKINYQSNIDITYPLEFKTAN